MKISHVEQISLLRINPAFLGKHLAFWTMTVAAGIVGWSLVAALGTEICVASQLSSAAIQNGIHRLVLRERQSMVSSVILTMPLKDVLYFKHWTIPLAYGLAFLAMCPRSFEFACSSYRCGDKMQLSG